MAVRPFRTSRFSALALFFLFLAPPGCCQFANLDRVGEQLAKRLKQLKPKMIAVADLSALQGAVPGQGHYFSEFLTHSIQHHGKKLAVLGHADFDSNLERDNLRPDSFVSPDSVMALHGKIPEEMLIIGTITRDASAYSFSISAVRVSTGETLFSQSATFSRTEFIDSMTEPFPPKSDIQVYRSGVSGIGAPLCIHCPQPYYNDYARRDSIQGTCVFDVLISPEGRVMRLRPIKLLGDGLDEQAYNAIKTWKFKPATLNGEPVTVMVYVEIAFYL